MTQEAQDQAKLAKGIIVNGLGTLARVSRVFYLIVFSRFLDAELFGAYILAFAITEVASKFGSLGLEYGALRVAGKLHLNGYKGGVRSAMKKILIVVFFSSSIISILLYASAGYISDVFLNKPVLTEPLRIFSLSILPLCLTTVLVHFMRPTLNMKYENIVRSLFEPLVTLVIGATAVALNFGVSGAAAAHGLAAVAALVLAFYYFFRAFPAHKETTQKIDWADIWHTSGPMGGMEILNMFKMKIDLFVIGWFMPLASVGVYGIVVEIASVVRKVRSTFDPILVPLSQVLHEQNEVDRLNQSMRAAMRWIIVPSFALLGTMWLVPELYLMIFGDSFTIGANALRLFVVGQVFYSTFGLLEHVLAINGYAYRTLIQSVVLVLGNLVLLLFMVPNLGIEGAAAATSLSFIVVTIWRLIQSRELLGIWPFERSQLKPLIAFLGAMGLSLLVAMNFSNGEIAYQIALGTIFLVVYAGVLWTFGLEASDRETLRRLSSSFAQKKATIQK